MTPSQTHVSRWIALGAYVFALTLVLAPVVDLLTTVLPIRLGDLSWRYGFLGLAAGYLHTPMIGFGLAVAVALWQEDTGVLRALGIVATIVAGALVPVMGSWALDVMQMREMREPDVRSGILVGGVIQGAKYLGAFVVLVLVGVGASRTAKSSRAAAGRASAAAGSPSTLRRD